MTVTELEHRNRCCTGNSPTGYTLPTPFSPDDIANLIADWRAMRQAIVSIVNAGHGPGQLLDTLEALRLEP